MNGEEAKRHKVVLLGDSGVGKTSLVLWYTEKVFQPSKECTVGVNLYLKRFSCGKKEVNMEIWDTAGQERYASLGPIHCRNAEAVIMCYDISNKQSFESVENWLRHPFISESILVVLVGCKSDKTQDRAVTTAMGEAKARSLRFAQVAFFETSVVIDSRVDEVFESVISRLTSHSENKTADETIALDVRRNSRSHDSQLCDWC